MMSISVRVWPGFSSLKPRPSLSGTCMPARVARSLTASTKPRPWYSMTKLIAVPCAPQPKQW
jgi:hypothetical protein